MKRIIMKSAKCVLIMMLLIVAISIGTINAYAVEVVGENTGLRVKLSDVLVNTDNLNPGDTKTSTMTIFIDSESSIQTSSLPVWIRSEITEYIYGKEVNGKKGNLDDRLVLTVTHENGKVLHNGPISEFDKNVSVGDIRKGDSVELTFTVHLPGEATSNEYQGASLKVKWIVTTQYEPEEKPTPTRPLSRPTDRPRRVTTIPTQPPAEPTEPVVPTEPPSVTPTETPEIIEIEDDDIPEGPGEPEFEDEPDEPEIIIIEEEDIPSGLPKTGELPPLLFYCLGAGVVYVGIKLNKKRK